jgi:hypothetical protein
VRASSIACVVVSSSVRSTVAFDMLALASAAWSSRFASRRWESLWMMGQRSVAMPRRVSTEFSGEIDGIDGRFKGLRGVVVVDIGDVPKESAAMTS